MKESLGQNRTRLTSGVIVEKTQHLQVTRVLEKWKGLLNTGPIRNDSCTMMLEAVTSVAVEVVDSQ